MTDERFARLVARCERLAAERPVLYRAGVLGLVVLGFGYVVFWVALFFGLGLLALVAGDGRSGSVKLGIVLLALAAVLGRALWVRFEDPEGHRLSRSQVPELFALIDELRARGRVPPIAEVVLDADLNAAVIQRPRFGLLGGSRNYLIVGMKVLLAFGPEQFRAVLAHELGHIAGAHGRFSAWIYRVRRVWTQLEESFDKGETRMRWLFAPFLRRYAPYFNAYTFALARAQERAADRFSAETVGARANAEALLLVNVLGRHLGRSFWPSIRRRTADEPQPPRPHQELRQAFWTITPEAAAAYRLEALEAVGDPMDTHPSLAERLRALGEAPPELPPPPAETAADRYLGRELSTLLAAVDEDWRRDVADSWAAAHAQVTDQRKRLAALDGQLAKGERLDDQDAYEHADLVEDHRSSEESMTLLRGLLARNPAHVSAAFALGRQLLHADDAEGIGYLERAMAADPEATAPGCRMVAGHLESQGRDAEASAYRQRAEAAQADMDAAARERDRIGDYDAFVPHALDEPAIAELRASLAPLRAIKRAYLVRKQLEHLPDRDPVHLLAIERRWSLGRTLWLGLAAYGISGLVKDPAVKLRERVAETAKVPGTWFVVILNLQKRSFRERVRAVPGSRVFPGGA